MASRDMARLARVVKLRRMEIYSSRDVAAKAARMSKDTWQRVEESLPVRPGSCARIDGALRWAIGSCEAILNGGEPIPIEGSAQEGTAISTLPPAEREAKVHQIVTSASLAASDDLTAGQIKNLATRVMEDLKKIGLL
ncbi:hypothetical protein [Streptomyces sp. H27-D2]|uniref:hypothetical protein n=1 Tax=Streptomyces sp. H27-D2 TaxID=3046304 RepID=UPI002DB8BC8D|nr:hypothetical protein [Streptomyces sp. H27-D2]MEC4016005.1 hypothetical protein [Streptomyces sp. H27-D2]